MNALNVLFILAGILYCIFVDMTFGYIYIALLLIYTVFSVVMTDQKSNTKRKNIMIATWSEPDDPTSYV